MANTYIKEVDNKTISGSTDTVTIFVPIVDSKLDATTTLSKFITVYGSTSEFENGKLSSTDSITNSNWYVGNIVAKKFVELGATVVAYREKTADELKTAITKKDSEVIKLLSDENLFDLDFICFPNMQFLTTATKAEESLSNVVKKIISTGYESSAEEKLKRKSTVIVLDKANIDYVDDDNKSAVENVEAAYAQFAKPFGEVFADVKAGKSYLERCTSLESSILASDTSNTYVENEKSLCLPGCYAMLNAYLNSVSSNAAWYAGAGVSRGVISGLIEPTTVFTTSDVRLLQTKVGSDTLPVSVNPIYNVRGFGNVVWGFRTLAPLSTSSEGLISGHFLNIRILKNKIIKQITKATTACYFDQNTDVTWTKFKSYVTPLLDRMVSGNGITSYKIIKEKTDKIEEIKGTIHICPVGFVEDFDLTISIDDEGTSVLE